MFLSYTYHNSNRKLLSLFPMSATYSAVNLRQSLSFSYNQSPFCRWGITPHLPFTSYLSSVFTRAISTALTASFGIAGKSSQFASSSPCSECYDKNKYETIERNLEKVERPFHFKDWDHGDMSDAFWLHLGIYQKRPNKKSLSVMKNAWYWACHASHGLSSSFTHALEWCGIDLFTELKRTDLPEV